MLASSHFNKQAKCGDTCLWSKVEGITGGSWSKQGRAKPEEPIQKRAKQTRTGGVAQVVESLLNKSKALSSNTSTSRKKNKVKKSFHFIFIHDYHLLIELY
jgi:hypothetical protein